MPHRGTIKAINLNEVGAGTTSGVFEIYDSEAAAKFLVGSSSLSAVEGGEADAHSITDGEVTITGGQYRANNLDIPYINRDGTPTNPVKRLWMRINLSGSGTKQMSLSMTIEPATMNS